MALKIIYNNKNVKTSFSGHRHTTRQPQSAKLLRNIKNEVKREIKMVNDTRSIPEDSVLYSHTDLSLYSLLYFPYTAVDLLTKPDYLHTTGYIDTGFNKLSQSFPLHGWDGNVRSFHGCTYSFCLSLKLTVLHNMLCLMLTGEIFHEDEFQRFQAISR